MDCICSQIVTSVMYRNNVFNGILATLRAQFAVM
jgi:hypothetical protein